MSERGVASHSPRSRPLPTCTGLCDKYLTNPTFSEGVVALLLLTLPPVRDSSLTRV